MGVLAEFGLCRSVFGFLLVATLLVSVSDRVAAAPARKEAPALSREGIEFFESKIRPILTEKCFQCHSIGAEKIKGGLVLDSRNGWMKGGESGPVIVPGNPEKSRLIQAVRRTDSNLQMPPKEILPATQIVDLETWVRLGAPDPRAETGPPRGTHLSAPTNHWAFRPRATPSAQNKGEIVAAQSHR